MRFLFLLLALLLCSPIKAEIIRVGTLPYDPPFEIEADKDLHFFGFDIDIMTEICNRIQADCRFIPLNFIKIFTELAAGNIDLGLGAISITESREETFLFSLPYLASSGQYVTTTASSIRNIEDIREKRVGSVQGTLFKALVLEKFHNLVQIIEYPAITSAFQALSKNKVGVVITDEETARHWVSINSTMFKLLGSSIPVGIGYGIMANKKSSDLIGRVNKALLDMENDGTYLKIYNRYFAKIVL
ncbi:transporter substrate-binding domain-containing protein [Legionella micdadei]|uniref:Arginine transport system substrate-binding protein n=1 Tax=Legionella micdadei TaxID=451 RepID=A0A098GLC0_LEGMI|nr:transporter substrate-binding domain-containing protein [Legionella micdadei]KTD28915.1 arginine transport system periplasmic binding protein [Legionella micdadei]NSL17126.1 transporter substrate-binding domain-containing protein [Legionella micdadei]CEG62296.1 putative arginine 3rd transport system periplasmic binding protein [Legionella micdadei]SCY04498.1 arginine transport system substrate-binding protein [Legionella micdadei]